MSGVAVFGSMTGFDRFLFAFTIASHITLVATSIALIVIIVLAEFLSIHRPDMEYGRLAKRLTKVFTISFGVGTASGIVMAIELVTLFPAFMTLAGQTGVIELFYFEIFAFFVETIFLVLYVYYVDAFRGKWTHLIAGTFVAVAALISAVLIVSVNAWMNTPNGATIEQGVQSGTFVVTDVNPWAPFTTSSTLGEVVHVLTTTVFAGSMMIGGYFAYRLVKHKKPEERAMLLKGLKLIWIVSIVTLVLAGLTGTHEMATVLQNQPLKYAAFDANNNPGTNLPENFFGITIPGLQSLLAQSETGVTVLPGLSTYPSWQWPPLYIHETFDLMVLGGFIAGGYFLLYILGLILKRKPFEANWLIILQIPAAIGAYLVYQFGWITDEVGRQPWIIYGVVTIDQAANQSTSLIIPGILVMLFYFIVVPATFYFFIRVFNSEKKEEPQLENPRAIGSIGGVNY